MQIMASVISFFGAKRPLQNKLSVDLLVKCLWPLGALDAFHSVYEFRSEHLINRNAARLTKGKQGQERANEEWRRERGA